MADRLAVELIRHEPGWRLPRRTALARRYDVSFSQIDAAVAELAERHLIRRLPDGQLYRASPAEYLIPLPGADGLRSRIDPLGAALTCRSRQASWHPAPADIGWSLHVGPAEQVYVVQAVWAAGGQPAAHATTYLLADAADALPAAGPPGAMPPVGHGAGGWAAATGQSLLSLTPAPEPSRPPRKDLAAIGKPAALQVEVQPPAQSVARRLGLSAGQPAATVTVRFGDPVTGRPTALTVAVLRPELVRVSVQADDGRQPTGK